MSRYTGPVCRLCRREGRKLFLKGERCYTDRCAVTRRNFPPGQHGQGRKKVSGYGLQLRAKQMAKRFYGVQESQFHKYYEMAERQAGMTGENLLRMLERRLDNIVYRLGFGDSRASARQMVTHGFFTVNGRKVNIPSYLCKAGDVIAVKESRRDNALIKQVIEGNESRPVPKWLDADRGNLIGTVVEMPNREDIDLEVEETLIVELYSK